jgi:hypothetical protein
MHGYWVMAEYGSRVGATSLERHDKYKVFSMIADRSAKRVAKDRKRKVTNK